MVCFLSSHISVIILVRISTLSPYSKLIKSQDSSSHACNLTPDRLKFKLAGPPCVLLPCICLHGLGTYGQKIKVFINQSLTFVKCSMFSGKQKQNTRTTITKTRTTTRPKDQILLREHFTGRITFVQSRNKFVCNARSCPHKSRPSSATNIIRESVVICSPTHIGETLWSKE